MFFDLAFFLLTYPVATLSRPLQQRLQKRFAEFDKNRIELGVNDTERAEGLVKDIVGKRLTYRRPNGKSVPRPPNLKPRGMSAKPKYQDSRISRQTIGVCTGRASPGRIDRNSRKSTYCVSLCHGYNMQQNAYSGV